MLHLSFCIALPDFSLNLISISLIVSYLLLQCSLFSNCLFLLGVCSAWFWWFCHTVVFCHVVWFSKKNIFAYFKLNAEPCICEYCRNSLTTVEDNMFFQRELTFVYGQQPVCGFQQIHVLLVQLKCQVISKLVFTFPKLVYSLLSLANTVPCDAVM